MQFTATGRRPGRLARPSVAGILLLGLVLVGCATPAVTPSPSAATPSPSAIATPSPAPSLSAVPSGSAAPTGLTGDGSCVATDLAVSSGAWDAAAGSRGAEVLVQNQGDAACTLPDVAQVSILDAGSQGLLESPAPTGTGPTLEPDGSAMFIVLFSNWCDQSVALPLHVVLRVGDAGIQVPSLDMTATDLPPCNGPDQPPSITVNPWTEG
jgi:hypothetical protein